MNDIIDWLFEELPLPEGVVCKAEATYHDKVSTSIYARRNLLLDFTKCSDKEFEEIDFKNFSIKKSTIVRLLRLFYFDVFESAFGELGDARLSGRPGEDTIVCHGEKFMSVMRVSEDGEPSARWYLDFAVTVFDAS